MLLYLVITGVLIALLFWVLASIKTRNKAPWLTIAIIGVVITGISFLGPLSFGSYLFPLGITMFIFSMVRVFNGKQMKISGNKK